VREQAFGGQHRRGSGVGSAIRRAVPIRAFSDWNDPLPGYFEIDSLSIAVAAKLRATWCTRL
jgi:hypothetical protein